MSPQKTALHWEAILCTQDLTGFFLFFLKEVMFEGSKASISLQGNLRGGVFKVAFHNVDEGKEAGATIKALRSISNRMVMGLDNTCQCSARGTEDISSSRSLQGWNRCNEMLFQVNCWSPRCLVRADYQRHIFDDVYQNCSLFWTALACELAKLRLTRVAHFSTIV